MFTEFIDGTIRICITCTAADLLYRFYTCISEYVFFRNRYVPPNRLRSIIGRCFSVTPDWWICWVSVLFLFLLRILYWRKLLIISDLGYMPLYWLWRMLQNPHSSLDFAIWIRNSKGVDYGEGMASNYFHGYLALIMPSHTGDLGIRQRILQYSNTQNVEFIIDRLVILIPNIMYVPPKIESRILEKVQPLEPVIKNRAGVHRPYKNDVYRFTEKINGKIYYIALEGVTPLLSFYEAMHSNYTSSKQMQDMQREILFKFSKSLKKMVKTFPGTQNEVEIIWYNAYTGEGENQDVGIVLKAHFESIWEKTKLKNGRK